LFGRLPHPGENGGAGTGPSPVDRGKTGSKHHLICDGHGTPLKVITTGGNINDVTRTLALVDGVPPVAGRPGRSRKRPDALLRDKGYDSNLNRCGLRKRRVIPVISYKERADIHGLGKLRYIVEQTFSLLYNFKHLATRWERRLEFDDALSFPRLQPHLLASTQQTSTMIALRALKLHPIRVPPQLHQRSTPESQGCLLP
jgi:transposase